MDISDCKNCGYLVAWTLAEPECFFKELGEPINLLSKNNPKISELRECPLRVAIIKSRG